MMKTRHCIYMRIACFIAIIGFLVSPLRVDFSFTYSTVSADESEMSHDLRITEDVTWSGAVDLSAYDGVFVDGGATVTIEKGATVLIQHMNVIDGRIVAEGTIEEPITMRGVAKTSDDDFDPYCTTPALPTIQFDEFAGAEDSPVSIFSFVIFENMGTDYTFDDAEMCAPMALRDRLWHIFFPSAYAAEARRNAPAFLYNSGRVEIKSCVFDGNNTTDVQINAVFSEHYNTHGYIHITNSNFSNNSRNTAVQSHVIQLTDQNAFTHMSHFQECIWDYAGNRYVDVDKGDYYESCFHLCSAEHGDVIHDRSRVVLHNNWYGVDESGPTIYEWESLSGRGEEVSGDFTLLFLDWRPTADFASNVLFLPGVKASRLHHEHNQVWPPTLWGNDYKQLLLDKDGNSKEFIFAGAPIDEVAGVNIYKRFLGDLQRLREKHFITDYTSFGYDWRHAVDTIAQNGTIVDKSGTVKKPVDEIEKLAQSSVSGNVTIVAHSNGGLLAKAIMQELEKNDKDHLIDNIILVGTPQMGTPKAILTMLYGFDEKILTSSLISEAEARQVVENMPSAYGLLPNETYFNRAEYSLIDFAAQHSSAHRYTDAYGEKIDNYGELKKFLLAQKDGRKKPDKNDVTHANVLNQKLFEKNTELQAQLSAWTPPEHVHLIQIGGWGLDTISGVRYDEKPIVECERTVKSLFRKVCHETGEYESFYAPKYTVDGDKVVVTPSALMMQNAENVERYWFDFFGYNKKIIDILTKNRDHSDFLEIKQLRDFILYIIKTHTIDNDFSKYISAKQPNDKKVIKKSEYGAGRIRISLYSPLDIHLYDRDGNHTGPTVTDIDGKQVRIIEENIPNSYYDVLGEHKYVGWGMDSSVRVELKGYDTGSYTVKLEEVHVTGGGEHVDTHVTLANLPTSAHTVATFTVPDTGLMEMTALSADYNGDGTENYVVTPTINGEATIEITQSDKKSLHKSSDNSDKNTDKKEKVGTKNNDEITYRDIEYMETITRDVSDGHSGSAAPSATDTHHDTNDQNDHTENTDATKYNTGLPYKMIIGIILSCIIVGGLVFFKKIIK